MFRRDKDSKLDNEGLRRMREAIRQRIEQEEGEGDTEQTEGSYRPTSPENRAADGYTPPPTSYEPLSREPLNREPLKRDAEYSYLASRPERTTSAATPTPAAPAERTEGLEWEPEVEEAPAGPVVTTIAYDTAWRGTLRSSGPIRIEGAFEGEIITEQELFIAEEAKVEANVRATSIIVAGQLSGQITCHERLEVRSSGRVSGQIDAGRFVVQEGAFLGGQVRMRTAGDGSGAENRPALQRVR